MFRIFRAGLVAAAAFACLTFTAFAADKPFTNDDLANSAIELEAQIKSDAAGTSKPVDQLQRDASAAFAKNDFRTGMAVLGQIVAAQPNDAATWLRLARTIQQIRPANDNEKTMLLERASSAAYIAYQRAGDHNQEASDLAFLGTVLSQRQHWRPALDALRLSLELREVADVRGQYERMRDNTASACSITPSMPTPRRRGPVFNSRRIFPRAPTSRRSSQSPASTSRRCRSPKTALRRRADAWRALQHDAARRSAVGGA